MTLPILEGIRPTEPIGAVLRIGRKALKADVGTRPVFAGAGPVKNIGDPVDTDRFYICVRTESKLTDRATYREMHPDFKWFNDASYKRGLTTFRGVLYRPHEEGCWSRGYKAYRLGGDWPVPAYRRPCCSSDDGLTCTRLYRKDGNGVTPPKDAELVEGHGADDEEWYSHICPNERCEFYGSGRPCSSTARLYFAPRWDGMDSLWIAAGHEKHYTPPAPAMVWATNSAHNLAALTGFFQQQIEMFTWAEIPPLWIGVPFLLTLARKTSAERKANFPVVTISYDGPSLADQVAHVRAMIGCAGGKVPLLIAADSPEENEPPVVAADFEDISVNKPAEGQGALPLE